MLQTPSGKDADNMDKIMLLSLWAKELATKDNKKIYALGMSRPTYPFSSDTAFYISFYWLTITIISKVTLTGLWLLNYLAFFKLSDLVSTFSSASDYGYPQGELSARHRMANALNQWYEKSLDINANQIMFTIGGAAALNVIFSALNQKIPNGRILMPYPYYPLYQGSHKQNNLFIVPTMLSRGYKLNAEILSDSIEAAYRAAEIDGKQPSAFLLCDPNNPLATALNRDELRSIADVLIKYPDLRIILDEAYAEMRLDGSRLSLLSVAPELKGRIILLRSATKALSAAGERMAIAVIFDHDFRNDVLIENIAICGHAPKSLQMAFSYTMEKFTSKKQNDLMSFYTPKIIFVQNKIKEMGAAMPDLSYEVAGTFYVLADLSDFIGTPMDKGCFRAIKKEDSQEPIFIKTDEDIIYHLLFSCGIMLAPLSYFGMDSKLGYVRITCTGPDKELSECMNILENALLMARVFKVNAYIQKIISTNVITSRGNYTSCINNTEKITAFSLKQSIQGVRQFLLHQKKESYAASYKKPPEDVISSFLIKVKNLYQEENKVSSLWCRFIQVSSVNVSTRHKLLSFSKEEIKSFKPFALWRKIGDEICKEPISLRDEVNGSHQ